MGTLTFCPVSPSGGRGQSLFASLNSYVQLSEAKLVADSRRVLDWGQAKALAGAVEDRHADRATIGDPQPDR